MNERPILFSGPMVRALLAGTKTQTRRGVKPQPPADTFQVTPYHHPDNHPRFFAWKDGFGGAEMHPAWEPIPCPYGQPGDRLWVREAWAHDATDLEQCRAAHEDAMGGLMTYGPYYRATESAPNTLHWRPSIHMPRWASRITLEVTGVRVERLQDISEADAQAEGTTPIPDPCDHVRLACADIGCSGPQPYRTGFRALWRDINGPDSWDVNPWVWAVEFRRLP